MPSDPETADHPSPHMDRFLYGKDEKVHIEDAKPLPRRLIAGPSFARWAVADALHAAASIAGRASEEFDGTEFAVMFNDLRNAIHAVRDVSPEMKALSRAIHARRAING